MGLPLKAKRRTTASDNIYKIFRCSAITVGTKKEQPTIRHRVIAPSDITWKILGICNTDSWIFCQGASEPSHHVLCECKAISKIGHQVFGEHFLTPDTACCPEPKKMAGFIRIVKVKGEGHGNV